MTKVYLANGLFSESDLRYNEYIAMILRKGIDDLEVYLPQEQGINDKTSYADSQKIYQLDKENLLSSDILVSIIDGVEVDSGVALEIGIFANEADRLAKEHLKVSDSFWYAHDKSEYTRRKLYRKLDELPQPKHIIGIYTDSRQQGRENETKIAALIKDGTENQFMYRNLMVVGAIKDNGELIDSSKDLVKTVKKYIK